MKGKEERTDKNAGDIQIDFSKLVPVENNNKKLGSGAYASVKLVKDSSTGKQYALKEVYFG
jgi:hypothetical protein